MYVGLFMKQTAENMRSSTLSESSDVRYAPMTERKSRLIAAAPAAINRVLHESTRPAASG